MEDREFWDYVRRALLTIVVALEKRWELTRETRTTISVVQQPKPSDTEPTP